MNLQKVSQCFCILLFITIGVGCTQSTESTAQSSPAPTIMSSNSASPMVETLAPTSTLVSMGTPSPLSPPTYVPTLPVEDARKRLLDLLANNGDCRLPCLWGITPGISTYQQVQSIFSPLLSISNIFEIKPSFDPKGGFIDLSYTEGESDIMLNSGVGYLVDNLIVGHINFYAKEEKIPTDSNGNWISRQPIFDSPTFMKRIDYYSLSHILSEQGIPASVMFHASGLLGYPVVVGGIDIALLYPDQGIWVNYTMLMYSNDGIKKGCPANVHIEMELYPQGNPNSFYSLLEQTDWGVTKNGYKPLEEATSMSVREFYEIFRNPTNKCIETPANLWPTPESGGG